MTAPRRVPSAGRRSHLVVAAFAIALAGFTAFRAFDAGSARHALLAGAAALIALHMLLQAAPGRTGVLGRTLAITAPLGAAVCVLLYVL